jgi:hypothetical protein
MHESISAMEACPSTSREQASRGRIMEIKQKCNDSSTPSSDSIDTVK